MCIKDYQSKSWELALTSLKKVQQKISKTNLKLWATKTPIFPLNPKFGCTNQNVWLNMINDDQYDIEVEDEVGEGEGFKSTKLNNVL